MSSTQEAQVDPIESTMTVIADAWWVVLGFAVLTVLAGMAMLTNPFSSLHAIIVFLATWLVLSGIFTIARAFSSHIDVGGRVLLIISGALSLIVGSYFFGANPATKASLFALYVGIGFLFRGIAELTAGIGARGVPGRGWLMFIGLVTMVAGVQLINHPFAIFTWTLVVGWFMIFSGALHIVTAFKVKALTR